MTGSGTYGMRVMARNFMRDLPFDSCRSQIIAEQFHFLYWVTCGQKCKWPKLEYTRMSASEGCIGGEESRVVAVLQDRGSNPAAAPERTPAYPQSVSSRWDRAALLSPSAGINYSNLGQ